MTRFVPTAVASKQHQSKLRILSASVVLIALVLSAWMAWPAKVQAQASTAAPAGAALSMEEIKKTMPGKLGLPAIDEVSRTPFGWYELRVGTEIFYVDPTGNYFVQGAVFDLAKKENLTQTRIDKITSVDWKDLPLQDAIKIVRGNGKRQIAVFEDPNCGYCRVVEQNFQKINDVTIYVFLLPILTAHSTEVSKQIWCSADKGKAWVDWILEKKSPTSTKTDCANPIARNLEFSRKYKITGTPALFFADGARVPGAMKPEDIEKRLQTMAAANGK